MTDTEKKMAFILSTSPYLDVLDGSYDKAAKDLIDNGIEPLRHGRWVMSSDRPDTIICTCCDSAFDVWKADIKRHHYCPNCGAKMDGRRMESKEND